MLEILGTLALSFLSLLYPQHHESYQPEQVHTAWTERAGELSVMWVTELPMHGAKAVYRADTCNGYKVYDEWKTAEADWKIFDHYSILRWQSLQTAILTALKRECLYEYKVGIGQYWSQIFKVQGRTPDYTLTPPEVSKEPVSVIVLGDMGVGNWSEPSRNYLTTLAQTHTYDALFHLGDLAYNLYSSKGKIGDDFLKEIEPIAAYAPYLVSPGNHEKDQNFTHFRARFRMPRNDASKDSNFFYSFNVGPVHFILISTELYFSNDPAQIQTQQNWLKDDLLEANTHREQVPWIVVMGHKPTYCNIDWTQSMESRKGFRSNNNCFKQSPMLRMFIEDLMYEQKVDLYIGAHVHKYERNSPIYKNETRFSEKDGASYHYNPTAPVHIITGIAGNDHGPNPLSPTPQLWSLVQGNDYGFGRLTVTNSSYLLWEHFNAEKREVMDYLVIEKSRPTYDPRDIPMTSVRV